MKPYKGEAVDWTQDESALDVDYCEVGRVLASLSGVDLAKASKATVRAWEARGLALIALSRGDRAEAGRIMEPVSKRRRGTSLAADRAPKEEA
ncbi:TPA: hypothetical protein ACGCEE_004692 [Stenotrophomonas maltophilia]|uniref:hypothetical protein n=1 Tax=Stenotrophomonas maltophilia TaxID=40324 RepID=UPI000DA70323|nr:hypothetical protein [Stenotrophomonas maltophilia]MCI1157069.1 hypothetical protein [Stenotrophomonas maltophilia]PZS75077.1 hypothetical protein A7X68_03575 [Stenotrophomonas maltophilia]